MRKVAILGANGYIARNLIYVLRKHYPEYDLHLYGQEIQHIDHERNYTMVDMINPESVRQIDLNVDIVFMLVGKSGSINGFNDFNSFIDVNEKTLLNLLTEYRQQASRARIIFPSTRLVYKGKKEPQKEEDEKEFKTIYAANKFACEQYLGQYHRVYGIQYTILRICIPYGTMVPNASSYGTAEFMLSKASKGENISIYGDGSTRRTLTYMEDLCMTMVKTGMSERCANDVFNVGGEDYSLGEMAELIATKYGVCVDYVPWPDIALKIESGDTVFDSGKLDAMLNIKRTQTFKKWIAES